MPYVTALGSQTKQTKVAKLWLDSILFCLPDCQDVLSSMSRLSLSSLRSLPRLDFLSWHEASSREEPVRY